MEHFDVIVIGSGQGGGPFSTACVANGRKTALIERGDIGGTCINTGCTPTKTMVASARTAYVARRASEFGVLAGAVSVDMVEVRKRKRDMVERFRSGSEQAIRDGGVAIIRGTASFRSASEIAVSDGPDQERLLSASLIVIDTGTRPTVPPIDGLDRVPFLDSTSIMELDTVPDHLVVLGGGYIGVEFAQMFRRFGSEVTVIQKGKSLLANEDADVADAVVELLRDEGIEIVFEAEATQAYSEGGQVGLKFTLDGSERAVTGSHLLVAVGRRPNTEELRLENAGIEIDARGFVSVDDRLKTAAADVYAIGDCAGTPPFTHMSYDDFRILKTNLLETGDRTKKGRLVPYTVFIDPQLGRVGMTERQARDEGLEYKVAKLEMTHVARALESSETRGFMKALVSPVNNQILGCAILGMEGGELMAMVEIAMMAKMPYTELRDAIIAHPTLAESFSNLFGQLE